ncbi:MAG: TCR/Tet family MFS transporter [Paracoccaceae bacterium]|nr:TCR/Tet family MFS transporter [Paracoccaceae bacterium]MDG1738547.1 TCR/Tet family MFS transporter [Paracoccaceae bacterium]MDG2260199.1 TCR/Tet family MFS transporter [Paracoccaceae bacterium]
MDTPTTPPKLAMAAILMLFMIDAMGIGLMMPVMPSLIQEVTGEDISHAAVWGGILTTSFAIMQFACAPTIGAISDVLGRRSVLIVSLIVMCVDYLVMAVAGTIWLLVLLRLISGVTSANFAVGSAFIADISPPEKRAANFGLMGAGFGIGFVLGPIMGGMLSVYGTRAPFYAAAALTAINILFIYFVLPETVKKRSFEWPKWEKINPLSAFKIVLQHRQLRLILTIILLNEISFIVYPAVWSFFTIERFAWTPSQVGMSLALFGICMAVVQAVVIRVYLKYLGEVKTVVVGLSVNVVVFSIMTFLETGWIALVLIPLSAMGAVILPPLKAIMSKQTPDDAQGALLGVVSSTSSVGAIFGPLIATFSFRMFTGDDAITYLPGIPFAVSALMMVISLFLIARINRTPS